MPLLFSLFIYLNPFHGFPIMVSWVEAGVRIEKNLHNKQKFVMCDVKVRTFHKALIALCSSVHLVSVICFKINETRSEAEDEEIHFELQVEKMNYFPTWEIRWAIKPLMTQKGEKG